MITLMKFYADWCGPCRAMQPTMDKIKEEFKDQVIFVDVDIDDNPQTRADYSIRSIPAFVLIEDGEEVERQVGSMTYASMKDWLEGGHM